MKCLIECGYEQKPDNLEVLTKHLQQCVTSGACSSLETAPYVIWKNGEFSVVTKVTKKDTIFPTLFSKES
jgi:hypothetical protein